MAILARGRCGIAHRARVKKAARVVRGRPEGEACPGRVMESWSIWLGGRVDGMGEKLCAQASPTNNTTVESFDRCNRVARIEELGNKPLQMKRQRCLVSFVSIYLALEPDWLQSLQVACQA
jgi:ribosome modulation factor